MVWHKAWLDTRARFLVMLPLCVCMAAFVVFEYHQLQALLASLAPAANVSSEALDQAVATVQTFPGYVWSQWFGQNFSNLAWLLAAMLGSGTVLSASGRGQLFSLALPVPRGRWLAARATVGLAELFVLALVPSFAIVLVAPAVGEHYSLAAAAVHGSLIFVVASAFFALAMLASTIVDHYTSGFFAAGVAGVVLKMTESAFPAGYGAFGAMSGRTYYYGGTVPWVTLIVAAALTLALLYAAAARLARRDF
jgi:hypothetical protein